MDYSIISIGESSFSDIIDITDFETETLSEMTIINEKLDKEVDEDLVSAFNDISENEDKSEDGDDRERNLITDSSFASETDLSLVFSEANPISHQRSNTEFENGLTNEDLYNETEESNKNKLPSNLQDFQNLISDYQYEKDKLLEEVRASKSLLSSMTETKDEIQMKLESSEFTIKLLKIRLNELDRADHLSGDHHNSILEEIKLWDERDILSYIGYIVRLQSLLKTKMKEFEDLILVISELQRKCPQQLMEKVKQLNQISEEFLALKKCQLFRESGTIEEINRLRLQVHHLREEMSCIERENSLLKENSFKQWARSLLLWPLQYFCGMSNIIGFPFLK